MNVDQLKEIMYSKIKAIHVERYPYNDFCFKNTKNKCYISIKTSRPIYNFHLLYAQANYIKKKKIKTNYVSLSSTYRKEIATHRLWLHSRIMGKVK